MSRDIVESFGARIRRLREQQGLSQIALAAKVGIENAYLSRVETGQKEPCLRVIGMLADGLGVSLRKIFWDL
jgi:transcriptional regulator with XRE-family HTH domain